MSGKRHGPNNLVNYLTVHSNVMQQFVLGDFVLKDELTFEPFGDGFFIMQGSVECVGGISVQVRKLLQLVGEDGPRTLIQTVEYNYNASVKGLGNVLRYDSPHPTHNTYHHVHRYDIFNGDSEGTVEEIGEDRWPTLGEVMEELRQWYFANFEALEDLKK